MIRLFFRHSPQSVKHLSFQLILLLLDKNISDFLAILCCSRMAPRHDQFFQLLFSNFFIRIITNTPSKQNRVQHIFFWNIKTAVVICSDGIFILFDLYRISRSFFADSSYMLSFSVLCSCVCSRLISPSVSSWHKQDNTLMHQSPGHIQRRTPYNF